MVTGDYFLHYVMLIDTPNKMTKRLKSITLDMTKAPQKVRNTLRAAGRCVQVNTLWNKSTII